MSDLRPKKVVLFPKSAGWKKIVFSPTRPHQSNVYENMHFCLKKSHKIISTSKFVPPNLRFFPFKQ